MQKVRFDNNVRITIERGDVKIENRGFDGHTLYDIVKVRTTNEEHVFIFSIRGKNWRGVYDGNDFNLFGLGDEGVANRPSWDEVDRAMLETPKDKKDKHFQEFFDAIPVKVTENFADFVEITEVKLEPEDEDVTETKESIDTGKSSGGLEKNIPNWKRHKGKKRKR